MTRDTSYWEGHTPTREEYEEIISYCDDGDCYNCPYYWDDTSHCGHFNIGELSLTYLKDADKKIKSLEATINDLKDCLQEAKEDLQVLIKENERKITFTWASPISTTKDMYITTADALTTMSDAAMSASEAMKSISTVKEEEWLPF